jgi:hypothetical protein
MRCRRTWPRRGRVETGRVLGAVNWPMGQSGFEVLLYCSVVRRAFASLRPLWRLARDHERLSLTLAVLLITAIARLMVPKLLGGHSSA